MEIPFYVIYIGAGIGVSLLFLWGIVTLVQRSLLKQFPQPWLDLYDSLDELDTHEASQAFFNIWHQAQLQQPFLLPKLSMRSIEKLAKKFTTNPYSEKFTDAIKLLTKLYLEDIVPDPNVHHCPKCNTMMVCLQIAPGKTEVHYVCLCCTRTHAPETVCPRCNKVVPDKTNANSLCSSCLYCELADVEHPQSC